MNARCQYANLKRTYEIAKEHGRNEALKVFEACLEKDRYLEHVKKQEEIEKYIEKTTNLLFECFDYEPA